MTSRLSLPRAGAAAWLGGLLLVALGALLPVLRYLVWWPQDQWQIDVEVYRQGGESVLIGRPLYSTMTDPPQMLPFTYPPFSAILSIPLALMPFGAAGWVWTVAQVLATTAIVAVAGTALLRSAGSRWPLLLGALVMVALWLAPVSDGIRFGQVNAFIVLACLLDVRRPSVLRRVPPGVLVGIAMAVKLTPGVFVLHFLLCRRWREAANAVGAAVLVTVASWFVLPQGSFAFWGGALQDPDRLGPNAGTANQSLRGFTLRFFHESLAGVVVWVGLVLLVGWYGYRLARRAWLAGDTITEVGAVGLMACLLSPVAWIHHYHWMVVVILAVLGAAPLRAAGGGAGASWRHSLRWSWWRARPRLLGGVALTAFFLCRMPTWGVMMVDGHIPGPEWLGRLMQNSVLLAGLVALWLLARLLREDPEGRA